MNKNCNALFKQQRNKVIDSCCGGISAAPCVNQKSPVLFLCLKLQRKVGRVNHSEFYLRKIHVIQEKGFTITIQNFSSVLKCFLKYVISFRFSVWFRKWLKSTQVLRFSYSKSEFTEISKFILGHYRNSCVKFPQISKLNVTRDDHNLNEFKLKYAAININFNSMIA